MSLSRTKVRPTIDFFSDEVLAAMHSLYDVSKLRGV